MAISETRIFLKEKLVSNCKLRGFEEEKSQLSSLLKHTVELGESDSVLVVGPRGCGKTTLVSSCLEEFMCDEDEYVVVHLNGLIHTDDNLALKDIIKQLNSINLKENETVSGSFADNLLFVLKSLKTGNREESKPIVFILEEFHLFCEHKNQTLLYNLFDIAQYAQAPICVIGVTCRIDITEMLEKRVKSRFSHRQIFLQPKNSIEERILVVKKYMSLKYSKNSKLDKKYVNKWNSNIDQLIKVPKVIQMLRTQLELDPNEKILKSCLMLLFSQLNDDQPEITQEMFEAVWTPYIVDTKKLELLKDLSVLDICMIIAMNHHTELYDGEPFNFEMVLKQYMKFACQNFSVQVTNRAILYKAFERITDLELIMPLNQGCKNSKKEYRLYSFLVTNSQVKEAVNSFQGLPTDVSQWACSSII